MMESLRMSPRCLLIAGGQSSQLVTRNDLKYFEDTLRREINA